MSENGKPQSPEPQKSAEDSRLEPQAQAEQANTFAIDRLSQTFETSARRWELIVYPSLFAFIILAAKDVHYLAISVDSNMTVLSSNMQSMSDNMGQLTANVRTMAVSVESMARDVSTLEPMLASIETMDQSMKAMTYTTHSMSSDMSNMNRHIGTGIARPMSFFNTFMPW